MAMKWTAVGAVMLLLTVGCAGADQREQVAETGAGPDPGDLVCRKMATTGSRIPETVCAPPEAWEESALADEEAAKEVLRRPDHQDVLAPPGGD